MTPQTQNLFPKEREKEKLNVVKTVPEKTENQSGFHPKTGNLKTS